MVQDSHRHLQALLLLARQPEIHQPIYRRYLRPLLIQLQFARHDAGIVSQQIRETKSVRPANSDDEEWTLSIRKLFHTVQLTTISN